MCFVKLFIYLNFKFEICILVQFISLVTFKNFEFKTIKISKLFIIKPVTCNYMETREKVSMEKAVYIIESMQLKKGNSGEGNGKHAEKNKRKESKERKREMREWK